MQGQSDSPSTSRSPQPPAQRPPPPGFLALVVVLVGVFAVTLGALIYMTVMKPRPAPPPTGGGPVITIEGPAPSADPLAPDEFVDGFFIPPFEVVNQDEKPVTNAVFKDKITVIDFFFTHCPFICPAMTGRFGQLTRDLQDVREVQFLSFSVDPANDTPARLREYAQMNEADTKRWQFLTGPKDQTWKILSEGLKWAIEDRPEQKIALPGGSEMSNIRHPGWFALVGPDAKVLGIYKHDVEDDQQRLIKRVRDIADKIKR